MRRQEHGPQQNGEWACAKARGMFQEPVGGHRWLVARQYKVWRPPTDVYETDTHVIVKVEVAGMAEGDFSISLTGKMLAIAGVRHDPAAKLAYQQMEILYGQFEAEVYIPVSVDEDGIEATYADGFLSLTLPKMAPRQVPISRSPETPV